MSGGLVDRLNAWEQQWASALEGLRESEAQWLDEGAELARLVQSEAERNGENVQVIYWHDRSRNPPHGKPAK